MDGGNMMNSIQAKKTPAAQLAMLHVLRQNILDANSGWEGQQIEEEIILKIIVVMKNLKTNIIGNAQMKLTQEKK